jgi:hypothetical protein
MKIMSRYNSQTAQTTYHYAPVGVASQIRVFLKGMIRFEPAAAAVYAENARIRDTGRNWLM